MDSLRKTIRPYFSTAMLGYSQIWWFNDDVDTIARRGHCPLWGLNIVQLLGVAGQRYFLRLHKGE